MSTYKTSAKRQEESEMAAVSRSNWKIGNSRRKPHNGDAGYVASLRHPTIKGQAGEAGYGWTVIYEAEEQGIDIDARYAVVCWTHGSFAAEERLKTARMSMKWPANFCEGCRVEACLVSCEPSTGDEMWCHTCGRYRDLDEREGGEI